MHQAQKENALVIGLITLLFSVAGCSSNPVIEHADRSLSPKQIDTDSTLPEQKLEWGGIVIAITNLAESSEVEILAYPLDERGKPMTESSSIGRFIATQPGYLEAGDYPSGRMVTATGQISAVRSGRVGEAEYVFPVMHCNQLALWPKQQESRAKPRIRFGFGASSGGSSYGSIGIGFGF
ncbi:MAG: Slp family lipoprotein [Candidatus Thiodiazotropha weberae]|nr:Slp family lipoprotein [Candidatus Thiodiazotropha lotti]MCG7988237.1 Slp family lipoprotein [Candidatus Thiodiazotropha lotti]MCG8020925.1 Slp family lipoprotein [Candidatus Thiodiazotropha lotti]MCW4208091.1 Slp family lipoprotein [Candidatus Thiodiazotropha lotti]MCW4216579.1 Slp family lipoprotein [Candidatus Thiodiazotropha lotti]